MSCENTLFYGDCLTVLKDIPDETADLIYLDPPFNSKRDYNTFFTSHNGKQSQAQIIAFEDTWHWGSQSQNEYDLLLKNPDAGLLGESVLKALRDFLKQSDMMAYLVMMSSRLVELKRVLKNTGSIYLHCDPTASHYLKIILDAIFGFESFKNEIIWRRAGSHNSAKRYGPIHDVILFYTKTNNFIWNKVYRPYNKGYIDMYFKKEDERGKYAINSLTGAGIRKGESGLEWNGINPSSRNRHWAIPSELISMFDIDPDLSIFEKLDILNENGVIYDKGKNFPYYKQYLSHAKGIPIQDIWAYQPYTKNLLYGSEEAIDEDVRWLSKTDSERLGYPTQKPLALLERIIKASSNIGDVVLDPFCGCGTAIHAAQKLKRKWIGIDITHLAVGLIKRRMHSAFPKAKFDVKGTPQDVESARFLAESESEKNKNEGRYQFQYWALSLIDAVPAQDKKKGADGGSDGFIWAYNSPTADKPFKINISVKSGKIPANHIRELGGMLEQGGIEICLLITLEEPSKKMLSDAVAYGDYEYPGGKKFKRIQILTIKDLLDGKQPHYLDFRDGEAMPKKAKRESREVKQISLPLKNYSDE